MEKKSVQKVEKTEKKTEEKKPNVFVRCGRWIKRNWKVVALVSGGTAAGFGGGYLLGKMTGDDDGNHDEAENE